jgi:hypothetical protein
LEHFVIIAAVIWATLSLAFLGGIFYLIHTKLLLMESVLRSETWITRTKSMLDGDGWVSRVHRLNTLCICFIFPRVLERRGEIKLKELYAIPPNLRRLVISVYLTGLIANTLLAVMYALLKSGLID